VTVIISGPKIEIEADPDGAQWHGLSDNHGSNAPCIVIPVNTIEVMSNREIANAVRMMVDTAWFARAIQCAEYFLNYAGSHKGWQRQVIATADQDPEGEALVYRYEDRDEAIKMAADMLRECREYAKERTAYVAKKTVIRKDAQNRYADLFVKIGRRDGFLCRKCKAVTSNLQIDHVIPISKGGTNELDNLQLLCPPCNLVKSDTLEA